MIAGGRRVGRQALPQPPVSFRLLQDQIREPVAVQAPHVGGDVAVRTFVHGGPVLGSATPLRYGHRPAREGHGHAVLAERPVLRSRAVTRPPRFAAVHPQLHGVRDRPPHRRAQPLLADSDVLDPTLRTVGHPPRVHARISNPQRRQPERPQPSLHAHERAS